MRVIASAQLLNSALNWIIPKFHIAQIRIQKQAISHISWTCTFSSSVFMAPQRRIEYSVARISQLFSRPIDSSSFILASSRKQCCKVGRTQYKTGSVDVSKSTVASSYTSLNASTMASIVEYDVFVPESLVSLAIDSKALRAVFWFWDTITFQTLSVDFKNRWATRKWVPNLVSTSWFRPNPFRKFCFHHPLHIFEVRCYLRKYRLGYAKINNRFHTIIKYMNKTTQPFVIYHSSNYCCPACY